MGAGGVRDLLVQMRLDNSAFKKSMRDARQDVTLLKSQFKETESDTSLEDASGKLQENLKAQLKALTDQAAAYEEQIEKLRGTLGQVGGPGSEFGSGILGDIKRLETQLSGTNTQINNIQNTLNNMKLDKFNETMQQLTDVTDNLHMAYSNLLGWTGETADDADAVAVSWESAMAKVYKIANGRPGVDEGWMEELRQWNMDMAAQVPVTFEELAAIEANAMQAGGVSADAVMAFTDMYARLMRASDLTMDEGAMLLGKFLTVTQVSEEEYARLASVIVDLGNNFAATESQIVETAQRSASALKIAGMSAEDILAISASALALGMEPDAAASSMERLVGKLAKGAAIATTNYESLLASIRAVEEPNGNDTDSAYDFLVRVGEAPKLMEDLIGKTQMSRSDLTAWLNSAALAEKYASALGMSVQQFGQYWNGDPGMAFANFFQTIGQMGEGASGELLTVLDWLGVYGIRERRQAANFATSTDVLLDAIAMARLAYQENAALIRETDTLFKTTESQRQINQNKQEAFLAVIGEAVKGMRQPFEDWKADMHRWFVEDMPDWVQQGAGAAVQALGTIGNVITGVGDVAAGLYYTGQTVKSFKEVDWKAVGGTVGKIAGVGVGTVAGVAGLFVLADALYKAATSTETISENLRNVEIHIDEESKKRALAAIKEVQDASDKLANKEVSEEWAKISRVVKAGYGDIEMFGTAIAYEQTLVEKQLHDLTVSYGLQIDELNSQIIAASDAGDDALAAALMADREAVNAEWKAKAAAVQDAYSLAISQVFNGMLNQREGMADKLEQLNKDYNLLGMLLGLDRGLVINPDTTVRQYKEAYKAAFEAGLVTEADFNRLYNNSKLDASVWAGFGWNNIIKDLLARMSPTISSLFADQNLYGMFTSAVSGGIFDNVDISQVEGALAAVMAAVNMKNVAAQGGDSIGDWEAGILQILVDALKEGKNQTGPAVEEVRDAVIQQMQDAFSSDSGRMGASAVGAIVTGNLATGILSGKDGAVAAMREVMAAVQAEAVNSAPLVAGVMRMGAGIGLAGATGAGSYHGGTQNTWNQSFTVTGSTIRDQQNIRKLAQEVMKEMRRTSSSVGLG